MGCTHDHHGHIGPYSQRDFYAILTKHGFKLTIKSRRNSEHDFKLESDFNTRLKSLKLAEIKTRSGGSLRRD